MFEKYKESGFTIIETLVVAAVIVIIIAIGVGLYGHYHNSSASTILHRQEHIDKNISDLSVNNYQSFGTNLYNGGYLTPSLYKTTQSLTSSYSNGTFSSNPAYSAVICVDEIPNSYTYGPVNINSSDNTATVQVNVFIPGSLSPVKYIASWVNSNGSWQLNNAICSK